MKEVTLPAVKSGLEFTGERFVPGLFGEIELEHLHRYLLAAALSDGKDVLDIACGEGYGSNLLAQVARSVCGVDIDAKCVEAAGHAYRSENLSYKTGSCSSIPLEDASVDVVASFETLEHVTEQDEFMREVKRVLRPGGILLLSTPDKANYNAGRNTANPFHVAELNPEEFRGLLAKHFRNNSLVGQRTGFFSTLIQREPTAGSGSLCLYKQDGNTIRKVDALDVSIYLVAVASDNDLPEMSNSLFEGRYGSNLISALEGGINERDARISAFYGELDVLKTESFNVKNELENTKQAEEHLHGELERERRVIRELQAFIGVLESRVFKHEQTVARLRLDNSKQVEAAEEMRAQRTRAEAALAIYQNSGLVRIASGLSKFKGKVLRRLPFFDQVMRRLRRTILFDREYYLKRNPDVARAGIDPLRHYVQAGAAEGRDPHRLFKTAFYLHLYSDVAVSGVNPLFHFLEKGAAEKRNPHPLFDSALYLSLYPDVAASGMNPLVHYIQHGAREGRRCRVSLLSPLSEEIARSLRETDLMQAGVAKESKSLRFETLAAPKVSIVIPVYNKSEYTLRCLLAIKLNTQGIDYEVIVVDDRSSDDTPTRIGGIPGVKYVRNETNLGFLRSSNAGAKVARGEYIVMLNNDTVVLAGWLSALLDTFEQFPGTGLAGSMLIYPDGRLQEAGGAIWFDATGWNIGRLQEPDMPEFNFVRDADYCSGASIILPKKLWDKLGGFDDHFAPAYYEDTDLAYRVRKDGFRVLYQPFSRVIHFEGISSGTDTSTGVKRFQTVNHPKFLERWKDTIAGNKKPGEGAGYYLDRVSTRHALVMDACTPTPDQDSGSCDTFEYLRMLKQFGYHVSFAPVSNMAHFGRYTENIQKIGVEALYEPQSNSLVNFLQDNGHRLDLVFIFRFNIAAPFIKYIREYAPKAKILLATVDLHFLREERKAELSGSAQELAAAKVTRDAELAVMRQVDESILVSEFEMQMLAQAAPDIRAKLIPIMRPVPGRQAEFNERRDVVFIGGFQHTPNVDAVVWFATEVWPLVAAELPDCRFVIAGSNMREEVEKLASVRVIVRGFVPDLGEFLKGARLSVAPLRFGAGIKGKIVGSLSHGLPCVATSMACEGMGIENGKQVLIGDTPEEMAAAVVKLYTSQALWQEISDRGIELARTRYSLEVVKDEFGRLLKELNCL